MLRAKRHVGKLDAAKPSRGSLRCLPFARRAAAEAVENLDAGSVRLSLAELTDFEIRPDRG
jgi:hypothetical protein